MMKKLLSSFAFIAVLGIVNSNAQCTPDISCLPANASLGVCPDSATGLPVGCVGVPYTAVVSIKVPSTATSNGITVNVDDIEIKSVTGLAPGLTYACSPASCIFPKNTNGCVLISGTPTAVHNQNIVVSADAHIKIAGFPATNPQTFNDYWSKVDNCVGVPDGLDITKFDVAQNSPNPFNEKSHINFSSPVEAQVEFKVYNVVGAVVYSNMFKAEKGVNVIAIEANSFTAGVYIYTVKNGDKTITKRMIVSK